MKRRELIRNSLITSLSLIALPKAATASELVCKPGLTPKQAKGPFYPVDPQLDTDADLVQLLGSQAPAKGEVVIIEGVVTNQLCQPVNAALVEIWQACATGKYNHPSDPNTAELDPNFQYWGKAVTDQHGRYRFRTIVPGAYPAADGWIRPPHIHFKISRLGYQELITQMYFAGQELNNQDLILQDLDHADQEKVIVNLKAGQDFPVGQFNIQIKKLTK
jgi:protocatechuate 3,4-dioxygenase, beta subunit